MYISKLLLQQFISADPSRNYIKSVETDNEVRIKVQIWLYHPPLEEDNCHIRCLGKIVRISISDYDVTTVVPHCHFKCRLLIKTEQSVGTKFQHNFITIRGVQRASVKTQYWIVYTAIHPCLDPSLIQNSLMRYKRQVQNDHVNYIINSLPTELSET